MVGKNIAYEEQRKQRNQMMLIPKILIAVLIFYLLVLGFKIIEEFFLIPEETAEAAMIRFFGLNNRL